MKKLIISFAVLVTAGTAIAQVNPTRPMMTGRGNVEARPAKVIRANATDVPADSTVRLEKFVVTGSLMKHGSAAQPGRRK